SGKVWVIKDSNVIYSATPNQQTVELEFTDKGTVTGRLYYYVRVQQEDQMLAWSSPMFVNYRWGAPAASFPLPGGWLFRRVSGPMNYGALLPGGAVSQEQI